MNKRDSNVSKGKEAGSSAPTKEKLTRAERRATQEAQRAAKAAAKDAGNVYSGKYLRCRSDMFFSLTDMVPIQSISNKSPTDAVDHIFKSNLGSTKPQSIIIENYRVALCLQFNLS